ncbi:MAG: hypothetical protein L0H94_10680 [Nitrospira sp.]|nr:hypothetical protein [Nitrospira sp.]
MTEQGTQPPALPPQEEQEKLPSSSWWATLNSVNGHLWAIIIAMFYLSGFLVQNAHLSQFGLSDFEFVSGRYLLAAANFAFFLVCFYLFAGRAVLYTPRWLSEDIQQVNRVRQSRFWSVVVFVHSFSRFIFFCCLSAALYTTTALGQIETAWFYAVLSGAFFITYTLDISNFDVRFLRANEIVQIIVEVLAIYAFFAGPKIINMVGVFGLYLVIALYINFVFDSFKRRKITLDRIGFTAIYSAVFVLVIALSFGATYFGQVSSKIGGGRPLEIVFSLAQNTRSLLPDSFIAEGKPSLSGRLLYQTDKYLYVSIADQTIRFRADDISLMVLKPEPSESFLKVFEAFKPNPTKTANDEAVLPTGGKEK